MGRLADLGAYKPKVEEVAERSPLATAVPNKWRSLHTPFCQLYDMIKDARNDAMHIGASARHLTTHAIELALILEHALRMCEESKYVSDYMVRDPVCTSLWQPISFIRQRMLANSFSYLPVQEAAGKWCLVSDLQVAKYLQGISKKERYRRLAKSLEGATEIVPLPATCLSESMPIGLALAKFDGVPILAFRDNAKAELTGILTAFDLL